MSERVLALLQVIVGFALLYGFIFLVSYGIIFFLNALGFYNSHGGRWRTKAPTKNAAALAAILTVLILVMFFIKQ
jgi:hypothetical protein